MASRSRSHPATSPRRRLAFTRAAAYRAAYGSDQPASVVAAALGRDPALAHTPGLVSAAASLPLADPVTAASRQIARLASVLVRDDRPVSAMDAWRLSVVVARLVDEVDAGSSFGSGVLCSSTRAAHWWGVSQPTASVALRRLIDDSGALVVIGRAGRTRRVRLGIGNPGFDADAWLDPGHPWFACTDPVIAYAPSAADRRARVVQWLSVVRGEADGDPVEPDPAAAERHAAGLARYREHAERSRQMILGFAADRESDKVVRRVMRGLPAPGGSGLDAWMAQALRRAQAEPAVDADRIIAVARARGHSESVAAALGSRLSDAAGSSSGSGWSAF